MCIFSILIGVVVGFWVWVGAEKGVGLVVQLAEGRPRDDEALALEAVDALRAGKTLIALSYMVGTVVITVAGCWIGYWAGQNLGR